MAKAKSPRTLAKEAMQRNKRMARTLGALVASMTFGAALLDWVQPKRVPAATARTELMSVLNKDTEPADWRSIQLDPQSPGSAGKPAHFLIEPNGQAFSTELWQNQQPVGNEGIVRIGLIAPDNSNQVTPVQWSKAREVVGLLQRACAIGSEQVHFDMLAVPSVEPPKKSSRPPARPVP